MSVNVLDVPIRDFNCELCNCEWSEESTAGGAEPTKCPECAPRAARHRAIREATRKRLAETRSDSVLADASQVANPTKLAVATAIKGLAYAKGRKRTSAAARELAVQALAWSLRLSVGADGVSDSQPS